MASIVSVSKYGRKHDEFLAIVEQYKKDIPYDFHSWIDSYAGKWTATYYNSAEDCLEAAISRNLVKMLYHYSTWEFFNPFVTLAGYKDKVHNYYVRSEREEIAREIKLEFRKLMESLYNFGVLE